MATKAFYAYETYFRIYEYFIPQILQAFGPDLLIAFSIHRNNYYIDVWITTLTPFVNAIPAATFICPPLTKTVVVANINEYTNGVCGILSLLYGNAFSPQRINALYQSCYQDNCVLVVDTTNPCQTLEILNV